MSERGKTAKAYLRRAYRLNQRIDSKLIQLAQLREMSVHITVSLNDMKVQSSSSKSRMEDTVIKILELESELNREIDALVDFKNEIRKVLDDIDNPEYRFLLEERYLCFRSWDKIAEDMGYGIDNVFKIHQKALNAVRVPK